eukprot:95302_1
MGGGGLAFLSKKPWHTTNINNVERVWKAEQKAANEKKLIAEIRKKREEERQVQEMRNVQIEAGLINPDDVQRLEWMYKAPMSGTSAEDHLLGAEIKDEKGDLESLSASKNVEGSLFLDRQQSTHASVLDAEARVREDPLLQIKQRELAARRKIITNPLKMRKLREESAHDDEKLLKKLKKMKKREKRRAEKDLSRAHKKKRRHSEKEESSDFHRPRSSHHESREYPSSSHAPSTRSPEQSRASSPGKKYGLIHPKGEQSAVRSAHRRAQSKTASDHSHSSSARPSEPTQNYRRNRTKRPRLSEDERKAKLAEMARNAESNDSLNKSRLHNFDRMTERDLKREKDKLGRRKRDHKADFFGENEPRRLSRIQGLRGRPDWKAETFPPAWRYWEYALCMNILCYF